jgi:hypothetical protein
MIALVFPFQSEMEAFLSGLAPAGAQAGKPLLPGAPSHAESLPLKSLRNLLPLREMPVGGFRAWTLASHPAWRLMVSGQGKVETALACQTLHDALSPSAYLLLGSACALDPALRPGDLVLADPGIEADFQPDAPPPRFPARHPLPFAAQADAAEATTLSRVQAGAILSADRNIFDPNEKQNLFATHRALAFAWEGAGFHRFLRRNQAMGWELRLITETAAEPRLPHATLQTRMAQGFPAVYPILDTVVKSLPAMP